MTQTTQIPAPPSWATSVELQDAGSDDAWTRCMHRLLETPEGWSSERPGGEPFPMLVELEVHRSAAPDGLLPDAIRLEVPADMFGGRYIDADTSRRLAAALSEAADLLDATEVA
jgi:hypothetical protein